MEVIELNKVKIGDRISAEHHNRIVKEHNFIRQISGTSVANAVSQVGNSSCITANVPVPKMVRWFPAVIKRAWMMPISSELHTRVFGFIEQEVVTSIPAQRGHHIFHKELMPRESYEFGEKNWAFEINQHFVPFGTRVMMFELDWDGMNRSYGFSYDGDGSFWARITDENTEVPSGAIAPNGPQFINNIWRHSWERVYIDETGVFNFITQTYPYGPKIGGVPVRLPYDECYDVTDMDVHNYIVDVKGRRIPIGAIVRVIPQALPFDNSSRDPTRIIGQFPWYVTDYYSPGVLDETLINIGNPGEGSESADTGEWNRDDAFAKGENGFETYITTRVVYNHAGDKKLYGFSRTLQFDAFGMLYNVSQETQYTIDEPESCP